MDLADETVVGLPRSNLVKPKSVEVASSTPAAPAWIPPPVPADLFAANPFAAPSSAADPFAAAPETTREPIIVEPAARESFDTKADSIEIEVATSQRAPQAVVMSEPMGGPYDSAPSASELLERAASLGPMRMTWESIVLPADPVLDEKRQPHVAERRARLTRMVKIGLGACVGVCVLASAVSAVSALSSDSSSPPVAAASVGKTVASKGVVPVEPLDGTRHAKATRRAAPAATTAAIVRTKRR